MTSKNILITGTSSGIGATAIHRLQQQGYTVLASTRRPEDADKIRQQGLWAYPADLNHEEEVAALIEAVAQHTGQRLYALFNNAGFGLPGAVEDLPRDGLRAQFESNVFGPQQLTNAVIPWMRAAGRGRIIYNSSILGRVCMAYRGAYNASKYALEALADTLRLELHGSGIHVSLIEPGPISSRFRHHAQRAFQRWIDAEHSPHHALYQSVQQRLQSASPVPFTLPPDAVVKALLHALRSPRPRTRYPITLPSHLLIRLQQLLPDRWMDALLRQISDGGQR